MQKEFIDPPELGTPPNNIYHHVVKVGNTVYIAGQLSRDVNGKPIHVGNAEAQTIQAWANLEAAVKAAGGTLADIVKTNTYVVGRENMAGVRAGRAKAQPPEGRPTSTTVIVAGLADPEFVVEVEAIAVIG